MYCLLNLVKQKEAESQICQQTGIASWNIKLKCQIEHFKYHKWKICLVCKNCSLKVSTFKSCGFLHEEISDLLNSLETDQGSLSHTY